MRKMGKWTNEKNGQMGKREKMRKRETKRRETKVR